MLNWLLTLILGSFSTVYSCAAACVIMTNYNAGKITYFKDKKALYLFSTVSLKNLLCFPTSSQK